MWPWRDGSGPAVPPGRVVRATGRWSLAAGLLLSLAGPALSQPAEPRALESEGVRVVYWPGQRALAERALRTAHAPLPLPGIRERGVEVEGTIFLAPTEAVFDSLTSGRAPGWSAGVAIPARRTIVLPAYVSSRTPLGDPIQALRHEIAHLALNAYLPRPIPRWFDEGYATWVSGGWDEASGWKIRLALLTRKAPPLDSLSLGWPGHEMDAELAYLLSASAVRHLATRSGGPAFTALLDAWRREGSLDAALRSTYQLTLTQLEREWREMVKRRYGWLLALSQVGLVWAVFALLLLVLVGIRRRRDREKLSRMRAEEAVEAGEPTGGTWWVARPGEGDGVDEGRREK